MKHHNPCGPDLQVSHLGQTGPIQVRDVVTWGPAQQGSKNSTAASIVLDTSAVKKNMLHVNDPVNRNIRAVVDVEASWLNLSPTPLPRQPSPSDVALLSISLYSLANVPRHAFGDGVTIVATIFSPSTQTASFLGAVPGDGDVAGLAAGRPLAAGVSVSSTKQPRLPEVFHDVVVDQNRTRIQGRLAQIVDRLDERYHMRVEEIGDIVGESAEEVAAYLSARETMKQQMEEVETTRAKVEEDAQNELVMGLFGELLQIFVPEAEIEVSQLKLEVTTGSVMSSVLAELVIPLSEVAGKDQGMRGAVVGKRETKTVFCTVLLRCARQHVMVLHVHELSEDHVE